MLLWEEYRTVHPGGYGYSRFCDLFRGFEPRLSPTMRQEHVAGDKVFVDCSGKKLSIVDPLTGEIREAEIFVAALGASGLSYAEATWTQTLPDWMGAHMRSSIFSAAFRGWSPGNLKSGVNHGSFYDSEINRSYGMMASHYGVGVLPTRPRRPKDKAGGRERGSFRPDLHPRTTAAPNLLLAGGGQCCDRRGARPDQRPCHAPPRRQPSSSVRTVEKPALASLPAQDHEFAEWRLARVATDYYVEFKEFFYSVPHGLIRQQVDIRATSRTIEIFHRGKRAARYAQPLRDLAAAHTVAGKPQHLPQLSHGQPSLCRHCPSLVQKVRHAKVADPGGVSISPSKWRDIDRNRGRLHVGTVAGFRLEYLAG